MGREPDPGSTFGMHGIIQRPSGASTRARLPDLEDVIHGVGLPEWDCNRQFEFALQKETDYAVSKNKKLRRRYRSWIDSNRRFRKIEHWVRVRARQHLWPLTFAG
jgi:hypothetical protein